MAKLFHDTHPEAEEFLISLIRKASIAKRISRMRSLSQTVMRLSRRAIKRANPGFSERKLDLVFVALYEKGSSPFLTA